MDTWLWIVLGVLYLVLLIWLGVATLRNGHPWLFFFGIFFPILWIVGAFIGPSARKEEERRGERREERY